MQEEIKINKWISKSDEIGELVKALIVFHKEIGGVGKDAVNAHIRNKYTTLDAMQDATREPLIKAGLELIQIPSNDGVYSLLAHTSGQFIEATFKIDMGPINKAINVAQAMGICLTYASRYMYRGILRLSGNDDTDGVFDMNSNGAQPSPPSPSPAKPAAPAKKIDFKIKKNNRFESGPPIGNIDDISF